MQLFVVCLYVVVVEFITFAINCADSVFRYAYIFLLTPTEIQMVCDGTWAQVVNT